MRNIWWWVIGVGFVSAFVLGGVIVAYESDDRVRVSFLDVGQGDAILVSRGGNQVLIDGGRDSQLLLERLGRALPFWDRTIEAVIATHPDEDHVGGLAALPSRYRVGAWLFNDAEHETVAWKLVREAAQGANVRAIRGTDIRISDTTRLEILYPFADTSFDPDDTNAGSVVARLSVSSETFLLTGDLPMTREPDVHPGHADVLKVGHHGSKSSTSDAWLDEVRPHDAILSVGEGNRYGHPAGEVLGRLVAHHAAVYRTDQQGTITYRCEETSGVCTVGMER